MSVAVNKPWKTSSIGGAQLIIVGCGDIGLRILQHIQSKIKVLALGRSTILTDDVPNSTHNNRIILPTMRFAWIDLDQTSNHLEGLRRYVAIAPWVIYLVPPNNYSLKDERMKRFLACASSNHSRIKKIIYVSTTGVYGAANGEWINETSRLNAQEPRAIRRIAAEYALKRSRLPHISILRAPGIYADNRLPILRLKQGLPVLIDRDDVPSNHIHADDLARLCWLALFKSKNRRTYNASDEQPIMHAHYIQAVAKRFNLPEPIQLPRKAVQAALSPTAWSMLSANRRIDSSRLRQEWKIQLKYPTIKKFLLN